LPSDAQLSGDVRLLEDTAINVETMRERIRETGVGQVVFLLDACRNDPSSGRSDSDNRLTASYARGFNFDLRNRDVRAFATIYATEVGQRAFEYTEKKLGYFTWGLVEGLKGGANDKGDNTGEPGGNTFRMLSQSGLISTLGPERPRFLPSKSRAIELRTSSSQ
jgi:hypothetical protein